MEWPSRQDTADLIADSGDMIDVVALVVVGQILGQLTGPQGQCAPERGEVRIQILDLLIPRWSEPGP